MIYLTFNFWAALFADIWILTLFSSMIYPKPATFSNLTEFLLAACLGNRFHKKDENDFVLFMLNQDVRRTTWFFSVFTLFLVGPSLCSITCFILLFSEPRQAYLGRWWQKPEVRK